MIQAVLNKMVGVYFYHIDNSQPSCFNTTTLCMWLHLDPGAQLSCLTRHVTGTNHERDW